MAQMMDPHWAWETYRPTDQSPWDIKKVGHLYRRAAFGATWNELEEGLKAGPEGAIDGLLNGRAGQKEFDQKTLDLAKSIRAGNNGALARSWWLYRILQSEHPLS